MATSSSISKEEVPHSQSGPEDISSDEESKHGGITPTRLSNESSPNASVYELDGASVPPNQIGESSSSSTPALPIKEFSLFFSRFGRKTLIVLGAHSAKDTDPEQAATYFVDIPIFKPQVTLIKKSTSEIIGICRLRRGSRTFVIGLGDPDSANTTWEAMKRHGAFSTRHWKFSIPVGQEANRRNFSWKRTHNKAMGASASMNHRKLVDEESGQVVALYLVNGFKSWKKQGKLLVFKDYGDKWETMMLVSLLGLLEQRRRRKSSG
jgi:hypothetical protein